MKASLDYLKKDIYSNYMISLWCKKSIFSFDLIHFFNLVEISQLRLVL